jgi:hypothetical protein
LIRRISVKSPVVLEQYGNSAETLKSVTEVSSLFRKAIAYVLVQGKTGLATL